MDRNINKKYLQEHKKEWKENLENINNFLLDHFQISLAEFYKIEQTISQLDNIENENIPNENVKRITKSEYYDFVIDIENGKINFKDLLKD